MAVTCPASFWLTKKMRLPWTLVLPPKRLAACEKPSQRGVRTRPACREFADACCFGDMVDLCFHGEACLVLRSRCAEAGKIRDRNRNYRGVFGIPRVAGVRGKQDVLPHHCGTADSPRQRARASYPPRRHGGARDDQAVYRTSGFRSGRRM